MKHNFHILSLSVYPYFCFFFVMSVFSSLILFFKYFCFLFLIFIFFLIYLMFLWFKDITLEGLSGNHNYFVQDGLKYGMVLFIFSEFMFFFCIFWVFFDSSIVLMVDIGDYWPMEGLLAINPMGVPLLNSFILLSSAASVTWSHYSLLCNSDAFFSLFVTVFFSIYFIMVQSLEYLDSWFSISSGIYGSVFFFSTGFHGFHVFIGGLFLLVNLFRMSFNHFSYVHHLGLEFSIVYWHFVDLIWLFLFVFVYWWSY